MEQEAASVSISLTVKDGAAALDFYAAGFGAEELCRMDDGEGGVGHAEFMIGTTKIYLSEEAEEWHAKAMPEGAKASCLFSIMTGDCDASTGQAAAAGAEVLVPPADQFWGGRSAVLLDPFGYRWSFVQIIEELTMEEVEKRAAEASGG